jgi:hypothetical protein
MSRTTPNAVLEMFQYEQERLRDTAQDINDRQVALDESRIAHNSISEMAHTDGWKALTERVDEEITHLKTCFEKPMEAIELAHVQGQIAALRWFSLIPSLSEAMLIAMAQAQKALNAEKDDFIQIGA